MNRMPAILVVDDDADNRRIASRILSAAGWRVDDVEDGESAIQAVRDGDYALVLLDIQMPGLDGYETATALRAHDGRAGSVPIVAFSALRQPEAMARARTAGMDGYVSKPFTPDKLIDAVKPWWPDEEEAPVARLAAIFGEAEIGGLLMRFRDQLVEVMIADGDAAALRQRAHRLAGLAGTLGFSALSERWLEVSEGEDVSLGPARIATRKALLELVRYDLNAPGS